MGNKRVESKFESEGLGVDLTNLNNEVGTISLIFKNLTNPARP